ESTKGHHVNRLSQSTKQAKRSKDRKWNRNADDQRAAPATEEEQNHERRESRRDERFAQDALDGGANEYGLIGKGRDFQLRRDPGENLRQLGLDLVDD